MKALIRGCSVRWGVVSGILKARNKKKIPMLIGSFKHGDHVEEAQGQLQVNLKLTCG